MSEMAVAFYAEFLDDYYAECDEHLAAVRRDLLVLEPSVGQQQVDRQLLDRLLRVLHSIKGLSAMVGATDVEQVAHHMESYLRALRQDHLSLTADAMDALITGVKMLDRIISTLRTGNPVPDVAPVIAKLETVTPDSPSPPPPVDMSPSTAPPSDVAGITPSATTNNHAATVWRFVFAPAPSLAERGINVDSVRARLREAGELISAAPKVTGQGSIAFEFLVAGLLDETQFTHWSEDGLSWELHETPPRPSAPDTYDLPSLSVAPSSVVRVDLARIDEDVVRKLAAHPGVEDASGILELWAFHFGSDQGATPSLSYPKRDGDGGDTATDSESDINLLDLRVDEEGIPSLRGKTLQPTVVAGMDPEKRTIGPVRIATRDEAEEDESCCAVTAGRYLVPNDDYHVMVTDAYAEVNGLVLGDMISLSPGREFEVVGMLDVTGAARIAGAEAFIPLPMAQALLKEYSGDSVPDKVVDTIFLSLAEKKSNAAVAAYAEELIGEGVSITTEANVDAGTAALASTTRKSLLAVSGFVLVFALLILVRNALDNVSQRVNEVGVMKAIGWRNADVARLFVAEAAYSGGFGGIIGGVIGSVAGWVYGNMADLKLPDSLNQFPECTQTAPALALPLYTTPSVGVFLLGMVLALAIGTIAGLAASRRAARLDPVDALRRL